MALLDLPNELILNTASFLNDFKDRVAFAQTCRHVYDVTKPDLYRFLAVDENANVAIYAALTGNTAVLDALWPYNPRFVNRLWEHDMNVSLNDVDQNTYSDACVVCDRDDCQDPEHQSRKGNSTLDPRLTTSVFDRCELGRDMACFDHFPKGNFTLLHFAALYGDYDQISWLLGHGANIDSLCELRSCREDYNRDSGGTGIYLTALQIALGNRREEAARLLIERGASCGSPVPPSGPHFPRDSKRQVLSHTPAICVAAALGLSETVQLLLQRGAQIEECDDWGYTALHHAADRCWEEEYFGIFKVLLDAGADLTNRLNDTLNSPLEIAFRQGNFAAVDHLLSLGASLDELRHEREGIGGDFGLLQFVCAFEAKSRGLRSAVHSCFSLSRKDEKTFSSDGWEKARYRLVARLLDLGHDPNTKTSLDHPWCKDDVDGYEPPRGQIDQSFWESRSRSSILPRRDVTALNAVSFDCDPDLVALLIRRGADVNAQDSDGLPPLWLILMNDHMLDRFQPDWYDQYTYTGRPDSWRKKIELLLQSGAKIDPWFGSVDAELAVFLTCVADGDIFLFLMEKATTLNISNECLKRLAVALMENHLHYKGIKCVDGLSKAEAIFKYHGPLEISNPCVYAIWDDPVEAGVLKAHPVGTFNKSANPGNSEGNL